MSGLGKLLMIFGAVLVVAGALLTVAGKWNLPLGRLPGDIVFQKGNSARKEKIFFENPAWLDLLETYSRMHHVQFFFWN